MGKLVICPSCQLWIAGDERRCVHCGAARSSASRRAAPLVLGITLAGCPNDDDTTSEGEVSALAYGVPDSWDTTESDTDSGTTVTTGESESSSEATTSSESSGSESTSADTTGTDSGDTTGTESSSGETTGADDTSGSDSTTN